MEYTIHTTPPLVLHCDCIYHTLACIRSWYYSRMHKVKLRSCQSVLEWLYFLKHNNIKTLRLVQEIWNNDKIGVIVILAVILHSTCIKCVQCAICVKPPLHTQGTKTYLVDLCLCFTASTCSARTCLFNLAARLRTSRMEVCSSPY